METETETTSATILARVPVGLKRELVERAREHDRSLSGEMRVLLRASLEREKADAPKAAA